MQSTITRKTPSKRKHFVFLIYCCSGFIFKTTHAALHVKSQQNTTSTKEIIHKQESQKNSSFIISKGILAKFIHSENDTKETTPSNEMNTRIELDTFSPPASQIGKQALDALYQANVETNIINLTPQAHSLTGTTLSFNKSDLEKTLVAKTMSPQELWKKTTLTEKTAKTYASKAHPFQVTAHLTEDITPPTDQETFYHRTTLTTNLTHNMRRSGLINHIGLRLNIANNLDENIGRRTLNTTNAPINSDINLFAQRRLTLNTAFTSLAHNFPPSFHTLTSAGYLDENFSGLGVQLLYRPYAARYAIGAQMWGAEKRDPNTLGNLGLTLKTHYAALIDAHYTFPKQDITLHAQAGRYLAGDIGGKLGIEKEFSNGAILSGEFSISNQQQFDATEEATRTKQSVSLKIPLGKNEKYKIAGDAQINIDTIGDDITQTISTPIKIYDITTPLNIHEISKNWDKISE